MTELDRLFDSREWSCYYGSPRCLWEKVKCTLRWKALLARRHTLISSESLTWCNKRENIVDVWCVYLSDCVSVCVQSTDSGQSPPAARAGSFVEGLDRGRSWLNSTHLLVLEEPKAKRAWLCPLGCVSYLCLQVYSKEDWRWNGRIKRVLIFHR